MKVFDIVLTGFSKDIMSDKGIKNLFFFRFFSSFSLWVKWLNNFIFIIFILLFLSNKYNNETPMKSILIIGLLL